MPNTFTLSCKCGVTERDLTNEVAYVKGWRLKGKSALCPGCTTKYSEKTRRLLVKRFGEEAVKQADLAVDGLYGVRKI